MSEPYETKYFYLDTDFKPVLSGVQNNPGSIKECINNTEIDTVYWGIPETTIHEWSVVAQRCECGYVVENKIQTVQYCSECTKLKPLPHHVCPAVSLEDFCDCVGVLSFWRCKHCNNLTFNGGREEKHLCAKCWQRGVR